MAEVPPLLKIPCEQRYIDIRELFVKKYGNVPTFCARASGRVNLIGEHIDYCGYAVLPMAIEQSVVIAARPNDSDTINLINSNSKVYRDFSCKTTDFTIDRNKPEWYNYFLCGYKGVVEHCGLDAPRGMDLVLDGTVPRSAGLSSSSALVCCAAMTTSRCNGKTPSKVELAEVCQKCERYIGTEGGGMDQAISFLAEPGTAKLIEFNPLRTTDISLPEGAVFVISNCCQEMNKAATSHFNTRVAECRLAAQVLAKMAGVDWRQCRRLCDVEAALNVTTADMVQMVNQLLQPEPYTKAEVCELLGVTAEQLDQVSLSEKTVHVDSFKLHDRALHVYSEASRVLEFKAVCDLQPADAISQLGALMNASHTSCEQMYECSCAQLDQLTAICRRAGALGSRLTGAGWGGCAVSLVPTDAVQSFIHQVAQEYFAKESISGTRLSEALFSSRPGGGAVFYTFGD